MLQDLERRRLFSELIVSGTGFSDAVALTLAGHTASGLDIRIANNGARPITIKVDRVAVTLAAGKTIRTEQILGGGIVAVRLIDLGSGDDKFTTDAAIDAPMTVSGGAGNDSITTGSGADSVDGGDGDDSITTGIGADTVTGGDGLDVIDGGSGDDKLDGGGDLLGHVDTLLGNTGNDTLTSGSATGSDLRGGDGNDSLTGGDGPDTLTGGLGSDTLAGGFGDDTYAYNDGGRLAVAETDTLVENPTAGTDTLSFVLSPSFAGTPASVHADFASAAGFVTQGSRTVRTPAGMTNFENFNGDREADIVYGNSAANAFDGSVDFNAAGAFIRDPIADDLDGRAGNDTLIGNGPDTLVGGAGDDAFTTYEFGEHNTTIQDSSGTDTQTADFEEAVPAFVLQPDVENLTLESDGVAAGAFVGHVTGNDADNSILIDDIFNPGNDDRYGAFNTVSGGDGDDTIISSDAFDDAFAAGFDPIAANGQKVTRTLEGNAGNDLLIGYVSTDPSVRDDEYLRGGEGTDTLESSHGQAWADYSDSATPVDIVMNARGGDVLGSGVAKIRGTSGNDTLVGDARDNTLQGGGGSDALGGGGGNDVVTYVDSPTAVNASLDGRRNDGARGENDLIGRDVEGIEGSAFNDTLIGSTNADTLRGLEGNDLLTGLGGDDWLTGDGYGVYTSNGVHSPAFGTDTLVGGDGFDVSHRDAYEGGAITLDGVANDGVRGENDAVQTEGVDGAATAVGNSGPNRLNGIQLSADGGAGDDTLGGDRTALLDGGAGADTFLSGTANYSNRTAGVSTSLDGVANDGAPGERDNVLPFDYGTDAKQYIVGSNYNDSLVGGDGNEILYGLAGSDTLRGMGGDDDLYGGAPPAGLLPGLTTRSTLGATDGADVLSGGDGNDFVGYTDRTENLRITLDGVANDGAPGERDDIADDVETIRGGSGNDCFAAGSHGTDFNGGLGADTFVGGSGVDGVLYDNVPGQGVTVTLDGVANDGHRGEHDNVMPSIDRVTGTSGDDDLTAGPRGTILSGGTGGHDSITGSSGDDVLILPGGGEGSVARGMAGQDLFINQNGANDTIDGGDGIDRVQDDRTDPFGGRDNDDTSDIELIYDVINDLGTRPPVTTPVAAAKPAAVASAKPLLVISGVSVGIVGKGVLTVTGSAAADTIVMSQSGSAITVTVGGKAAGAFSTANFKSIFVDGMGGNDNVALQAAGGKNPLTVAARVRGDDGNDTIMGGSGGDIIEGDAGSDSVNGGLGNDALSGDFVLLTNEAVPDAALIPDGSDTIIGGGGDTDLVTYTHRTAAMNINLANGVAVSGKERDRISGVELVVGSQANDTMAGSALSDLVFGGPGNDTMSGGPGTDQLRGGVGTDSLVADGGNDYLDSGPDTVVDRVVGLLSTDGSVGRSGSGAILSGAFNGRDYFTLANRYFGTKG